MSNVFGVNVYDRVNMYVADLDDHASLDRSDNGHVDFGAPVVAAISTLLVATPITAAQLITLAAPITLDATFGRTVQVTSTAAGNVIIQGRDYLGQPMTQLVAAIIGNVSTLKAFKYIDSIQSAGLVGNVSLGPGAALGLPFVASRVEAQYNDGLGVALPTQVNPVVTKPATNATGDTRGTIVPTGTLNGVMRVSMTVRFRVSALDGLYGVRQA